MTIEIHAKNSMSTTDNPLQNDPATVAKNNDKEQVKQSLEVVQNIEPKMVKDEGQVAELSRERVEEAVGKLQDYADQYKRQIRFSVDDDTGRTIVRLYDKDDNVLRQIPSEDVLNLLQNIEQNKGLLFTDEV